MESIKKINEFGEFIINYNKEIIADGELEWNIRIKLNESLKKGTKFKITFPAYAHQRSIEYVQNIDYWKPHFIYAYFDYEKSKLKTKIEKINSEFSHVLRWPDSTRIAIVEAITDWAKDDILNIYYGGINRMWLKGYAPATRCMNHVTFKNGTYLKYKIEIAESGNEEFKQLNVFPEIKVIPDKEKYLLIKTPLVIEKNKEYEIKYMYSDKFKNPIWDNKECPKLMLKNLLTGEISELVNNKFTVYNSGYYEVDAITDLICEKSISVCKDNQKKIYFGDTHAHSILTPNIKDNNKGGCVDDAYEFARDARMIDFLALVEQTFLFDENERQNVTKKIWEVMGKYSNIYNEDDKFVTFPGFEFHSPRGDTVVILGEDIENFEYPKGAIDIGDIWDKFKNKKYLSIPHFHRYCGGRLHKDEQDQKNTGFDLKKWERNDEAEVLCEFYSGQWGRFEYPKNPMLLKAMSNIDDNTVTSFLNRGKMWGVTASSDDHDLMPGHAGLTFVYSDKLRRPDIFNGLKRRNTYASTYTRVFLDYRINEVLMGGILKYDEINKLNIKINLVSPVEIRTFELIVNGEIFIEDNVKNQLDKRDIEIDKKDIVKNSYIYVRYKLEDENIIISSPIWIK